LQVARDTGWSFATVWRRAESAGIELTAGREAEGYRRLSPDRRAKRRGSRRGGSRNGNRPAVAGFTRAAAFAWDNLRPRPHIRR
jgi:hypothetical protein